MGLFNFKKNSEEVNAEIKEEINVETGEEWIWVDGYKGTDADMKCRGYKFKIGEEFTVSDEKEVKLCDYGFHLCPKLNDVFSYYPIENNNRFFKVKALVRKGDFKNLGPVYAIDTYGLRTYTGINDKLAAKSIFFLKELTIDEILRGKVPDDWTDEQKKLAISIGIKGAKEIVYVEKLTNVGYSDTFARYCFNNGLTNIALTVGSQEGLSMDVKVWAIFNSKPQ